MPENQTSAVVLALRFSLEAQTVGQVIENRGNDDAVPSKRCQLAVLQEPDKTFHRDQRYDEGNDKPNGEL